MALKSKHFRDCLTFYNITLVSYFWSVNLKRNVFACSVMIGIENSFPTTGAYTVISPVEGIKTGTNLLSEKMGIELLHIRLWIKPLTA